MNLPAILFGWLLASIIGFTFHLVRGGTLRRIALYLITSWLGFALGQQLGAMTGTTLLRLGAINLFTAGLGAVLALLLLEVLSPKDEARRGSHDELSDHLGPR